MQLKLLSWNIWYDCYFDEVIKFFDATDYDIIALQEVVENEEKRDVISFLKARGYQHVYARSFTVKADGRMVGNAVFSRHPIVKSEVIALSPTEMHPRNAIRADIKIGSELLHVFNTHLLHAHQKPSEVQDLQVETLIKNLPANRAIVMGDFNATPESPVIQKMRAALNDLDPSSASTWCLYPEGCRTCNQLELDVRLDYIFASKDLEASGYAVEESKGSDHLPIFAVITL